MLESVQLSQQSMSRSNAEAIQCFFRPIKKANGNNQICTAYMPNLSQIQTNKTKETQQLTLSFVSKSSPS